MGWHGRHFDRERLAFGRLNRHLRDRDHPYQVKHALYPYIKGERTRRLDRFLHGFIEP